MIDYIKQYNELSQKYCYYKFLVTEDHNNKILTNSKIQILSFSPKDCEEAIERIQNDFQDFLFIGNIVLGGLSVFKVDIADIKSYGGLTLLMRDKMYAIIDGVDEQKEMKRNFELEYIYLEKLEKKVW